MRERHWKLLMQTTGKHFVMDDKFCLGDLLALELHNYVDACSEIVDRAQKELNIEKQLKKIEDTWAGLSLAFSTYQVRGADSVEGVQRQARQRVCDSVSGATTGLPG